nr:DNA-processing protein DprA [Glutamicibacter soli]
MVRFRNRNRLIAAFSRLTIITEARHRSGALNTASHAVELGRDVAAVPGSVFSPNSAGTHRLIRSGAAELISSPAEAAELLGLGPDAPAEAAELLGLGPDAPAGVAASEPDDPRQRPVDGLPAEVGMLYDVLSFTRPMSPDEISARSGVTILQTLRGLSTLQGRGLAVRNDAGWKLART